MNKTHYEELVNKISNKMEKMSPSELDREIEESKKELIDMGLLEPAGRDLRGEVIYRQSAKGKRVVEELKAIGKQELRREGMNMIVYLCDKKKECNKSATCGGPYCNHTYDPEHAKNGRTEHPEEDKRFRLTEHGDYWEE